MKNVLKLGLAAVAISALAACGGGDSSEATDAYVGTWKSACYVRSVTNQTGTFYTKRIRSNTKVSATELASSYTYDNIYSDAACAVPWGTWSNNSPITGKYVFGAKAQFLGAAADTYVYNDTATPATTYTGYMVATGNQIFIADALTGSAPPTSWSSTSPYTKQ